ncbi:ankyrin repeat-containing domain protein [Lasiosphaeria hispida]|uniref:Ankyrin repeat-containing domain protein n=1 Tax=Lasiosphaeria hispida TaxID=260671 RepID=A0AAJ0HNG6_9PEZI|nr:ankyrin repeat-containing domain protein [Lasiosphaeria hispida]
MELLIAEPRRIKNDPPPFRGAPMFSAIANDMVEMVCLLIIGGAAVNFLNKRWKYGRSPLQAVVGRQSLEIMEILIEAGADVNGVPAWNCGATAFQIAAAQGNIGIVKRLVDLKARVNAPGARKNGRTALEAAAEHGRIDVVQLLLSCGADTQLTERGQCQFIRAIQLATREGHATTAGLLRNSREWTEKDEEVTKRISSEGEIEDWEDETESSEGVEDLEDGIDDLGGRDGRLGR